MATPLQAEALERKGVLLAGGHGSRLYPLTAALSKHLLPVYDKPLIYYPLTTLMLAGLRDVLVVSTPAQRPAFEALLGDGSQWGITIRHAEQSRPGGVPQALTLAAGPFAGHPLALILGDNIFYGDGLPAVLGRVSARRGRATIFAYPVRDPRGFGVVELDGAGRPVALVEKPAAPPSNLAVPGLYFYEADAVALAGSLEPHAHGETEITDLNRLYLDRGQLEVEPLGRGWAWLDCGTPDALLAASHFVQVMAQRTGLTIACPEEVAYRMGTIDAPHLESLARPIAHTRYGRYLLDILQLESERPPAPAGRRR